MAIKSNLRSLELVTQPNELKQTQFIETLVDKRKHERSDVRTSITLAWVLLSVHEVACVFCTVFKPSCGNISPAHCDMHCSEICGTYLWISITIASLLYAHEVIAIRRWGLVTANGSWNQQDFSPMIYSLNTGSRNQPNTLRQTASQCTGPVQWEVHGWGAFVWYSYGGGFSLWYCTLAKFLTHNALCMVTIPYLKDRTHYCYGTYHGILLWKLLAVAPDYYCVRPISVQW